MAHETITRWDLFVLRHQKFGNICVHLVSFLCFWLGPVLAFYDWRWLGAFFLSGGLGSIGHWLFKDGTVDGKEASSSAQVVLFSSKMIGLFLTGRYGRHIETSDRKFETYLRGNATLEFDSGELFKLSQNYTSRLEATP